MSGLGWGWVVGRRVRVLRVRLVVVVVRGGGGRMRVLPLLPLLFQEAEEGGCMGVGEGEEGSVLLILGIRFIIIPLITRGWEDIMGMREEVILGLEEGWMMIKRLSSVRGLRWIGWSMGTFMLVLGWGLRFRMEWI